MSLTKILQTNSSLYSHYKNHPSLLTKEIAKQMVKEKRDSEGVAWQLTVDEKIISDGNEWKFALF